MPPKAKPDTAAYQKLKKDIKEGTIGTQIGRAHV